MTIDTHRLPAAADSIAPVGPHLAPSFCLLLLVASCALASFALACATPFAAFAVLAAAILPLPSALPVIGAAWIVNQAIGFTWLHYPLDVSTALWGLVIGLAALTATLTSNIVLRLLSRYATAIGFAVGLLGAYTTYELVLFAATPFLGGASSFTAKIILRLCLLNAIWLIGLVAVCVALTLLRKFRQERAFS